MAIYHNHHIVPKHCGGTDDPSNLIRLTIEDHALAHKKLWEEHGRWQDHVAYLGLSDLISRSELSKIVQLEGARKAGKAKKDPKMQAEKARILWSTPEMRSHLSEKRKEQSKAGKNPMQGKTQNKVSCTNCRSVVSVNTLTVHQKKCDSFILLPSQNYQKLRLGS